MTTLSLEERLAAPGPKRILALDGGGIRGILTIQILKRIESIVHNRLDNPGARLCDYFDLIGGTSTGAIIAASLALGYDAETLGGIYKKLGNNIFKGEFFRRGLLRPKFSAKPLREALEEEFKDYTLGSSELRTGLAVVAKRADTGSPWVLHNNPRGKYYNKREGSNAVANKDLLLRDIVRASTAAPTYFEPERIRVAEGGDGDYVDGAFVDGGVSPHNNPSLQLLMLATLEGYEFNWETGEDKLMIVSLGTGSAKAKFDADKLMDSQAAKLGILGLASLMDDASALNETLMQWLSTSPTARRIDREVGNLSGDILGKGDPLLTYQRYEAWLERDWLQDNLNLDYTDDELDSLLEMDKPENMDDLIKVGEALARNLVEEGHFPGSFDVTS